MATKRDVVIQISERRKSLAHLTQERRHHSVHPERDMLMQDADHAILPSGSSRRDRPECRLTLEPFSKEASDCLLTALTFDDTELELETAVTNFVRRSLSFILHENEVFYELVFDAAKDPQAFWLAPLPPGKVKVAKERIRQFIPAETRKAKGLKNPWIDIPSTDVLHISFPQALGGIRAVRELTTSMERLGPFVPQFAEGDVTSAMREFGFDMERTYRRYRELTLARVTSKLGWDGRGAFKEKTTEFYRWHRQLRFSACMAVLRAHIISSLNHVTEPALKRVGLAGRICLSGFPSATEIAAKSAELVEGKLGFADIVKYIY